MSTVVQIPAGKILSCRNARLEEEATSPEVNRLRSQYAPYRVYGEDDEQHGRDGARSKSGYECSQDTLASHPTTFKFPLTRTRGGAEARRSISTIAVQHDQEDEEAAARLVYSSSSKPGGGATSQPLLLHAEDSNTHAVAQLDNSEYEPDYLRHMHGHTDADGVAKINAEGNLDGNSKGREEINAELTLALALLGEL